MPPPLPLVSVIIPVFNAERFLHEAIESVRAQTYPAVELIVVDDGSTDGSAAVARRYPEVRYLYQPNRGNGIARNTGVAAAAGEILAFIDADDVWLPGKLALQVEHLEREPGLEALVSHMHNFLEPGTPRPAWLPEDQIDRPVPGLSPCTLVIRRGAFERVGPFAPAYTWFANDLEWFSRAAEAGLRMRVLPDVLLRRRIHASNLTHEVYPERKRVQFAIMKAVLDRKRQRGEA